jgi:hypothetical protein
VSESVAPFRVSQQTRNQEADMIRILATAALLVVLASPAGAAAGPNSRSADLTVRVAATPGTRGIDLSAALDETRMIFDDAGITITWTICRGGMAANCHLPLRDNEVIVRLVSANVSNSGGIVPMGVSLVEPGVRRSTFASVYVDLVERVARGAAIDARKLLGRAVAHEIGHLLLNTNTHARGGLMRATWSRVEMQRDESADWLFADQEGEAMRSGLRGPRQ